MEQRICQEGHIWDLHIHSNKCSSADKSIKDLSVEEYVDKLEGVFSQYPLLSMISFTDHNKINENLYREYCSRPGLPTLLPGIEIDTCLAEDEESKHLVVYFDAINNEEKFNSVASKLNQYLSQEKVDPHNPVEIGKLLNKLLDIRVPFTISPHALKQGERGIDSDWHHIDPDERDTYKYVDQFFSFWETSGKSNIAYAVEFLREMNCDKRVSVIA